jgi:hypothetical protein
VVLVSPLGPPMPPCAPGRVNGPICFRSASLMTIFSEAVLIWATLITRVSLNVRNRTCHLARPVERTSTIALLCIMRSNGPF